MLADNKKKISKYLVYAFYAAAMIAIVFFAWFEQSDIIHGGNSFLYRNIRECPAFIKRGFNVSDLQKIPGEAGEWKRFQTHRLRIINSPLELPKRKYLSPRANDTQEFTISILLEMDSKTIASINGDISIVPGIFIAGIGENWEIYFNGKLIRSEIHLDETGRIKERRTWYNLYFPLDGSLITAGTNVLTFRILGDPNYMGTGLFFQAAPIYMDDYRIIESRQFYYLKTILCAIFAFTGIYYLMIYVYLKSKAELFNLFFGIFSILLFIYVISGQKWIYSIIPNSDITTRMEYCSLMLAIPVLGIFFETLGMRKISKISLIFLAFCILLCLTQIFFCNQYGEEIILLWDPIAFIYFSYIVAYYITHFNFWKKRKKKANESNEDKILNSYIGDVMLGIILSYLCGFFDLLDALFFRTSVRLIIYSIFAVHIGMVFILLRRFSIMNKSLEQSNAMLEIAVRERTEELEEQIIIATQASKAKSEFLATMSHEIRTPLNAVIGLAEIELRGKLSDSSRDNITQIHQSGMSLLGIINDILDISKIEAGGLELVSVEYETASFLSDTVNLNRVRIASKPINFILEIDGNFPIKLKGDELKVKQVLNNVLSNAIKYTIEGSVTLSVSWERAANKNEALICFTVKDTGVGIRKEDIPKLFTSYMQLDVKVNRKIEGTGLGLQITSKLVEMMGGNIVIESEYGRGSTFKVTLLQGIVDSTGIGDETAEGLRNFRYVTEKNSVDIKHVWMPNIKVLVVDDMPMNLQVARGLLEPYGLQVDCAASGQAAIELIRGENKNYDLIFMDHMMPEMDGVEATAEIRKLEMKNEKLGKSGKKIPIIALTANAVVGMREMFIEKGFNDFLSKPVDVFKLDEILNRWIEKEKITNNKEQIANNREQITNNKEQTLVIPGVNVQKGLAMTGGKEAGYLIVLSMFCKDVEKRLLLLKTVPQEGDLQAFIISVHALKSSCASIGAADVSALAAELEAAGKKGDLALIEKRLPVFTGQLAELTGNIRTVMESYAAHNAVKPSESSKSKSAVFVSLLRELAAALKSKNANDIDRLLEELIKQQNADSGVKIALEKISDEVLMTEYEKAGIMLEELFSQMTEGE